MIRFIPAICILAVASTALLAHTIWIEPKGGLLMVRFAEPGTDFEKSPGFLDDLSGFNAFMLVTNAGVAVDISKRDDGFLLAGASATNAACVETAFTVRGGRKPLFYARWQPDGLAAATPMLTFDLVPTGKSGEVCVYFRGKPLAGIDATLRAPDGKEEELKADEQGCVHFTATQHGQYLLTVAHYREAVGGFHNGAAYTETSHNCALTWMQP